MRNRLLLLLLLASLGFNLACAWRWWETRLTDTNREDRRISRVEARAELYDQLPMDTTDIVLLGDSHFEYLPANELFPEKSIRNRGLSGQTAAEVGARIGPIVKAHPKQVFILAGVNDIFAGRSEQDLVAAMAAMLDELSGKNIPAAVVSLPPNADPAIQRKIDDRNAALKSLCSGREIPFIELDPVLKMDGILDPALTFDGLHLNAKGNMLLAAAIKPYIR